MTQQTGSEKKSKMNRRKFLASSAAVGAGLAVAGGRIVRAQAPKTDDLNVAIIGWGAQGKVLTNAALKIPGLKFRGVCDIWKYSRQYGYGTLKKNGHPVTQYVDFQDMLDKEKDLDAVIVATPDFWHADHAITCMKAGINVYCEKEMSNDLAKARQMVQTSRETGKLLQIGHQRRSNPRYIHCKEKLITDAKLFGRLTHTYGQWNRGVVQDLGAPARYIMSDADLKKYGFDSMHEFRNWRWFKKYGGGPIVDLGSHQIDIFSWFLGTDPISVMAGGGVDYYEKHEWYDNVMAIFEYKTPEGIARGFYQTLTTTGNGGYYESFMGDQGTLVISENPKRGTAYREPRIEETVWDAWAKKGYIDKAEKPKPKDEEEKKEAGPTDVRESPDLSAWAVPVVLNKPYHQPHLENFFNCVRANDRTKLNCPGEIGYETAVAVLKVNEAVAAGKKLEFAHDEFKV